MTLSQTSESDEEGVLPPHSPPFSPRDRRMLRSPSVLAPPLFRPKFTPLVSLSVSSSLSMSLSVCVQYGVRVSFVIAVVDDTLRSN